MATITENQLSPVARTTWLKAMSAFELKNFGYAVQLIQSVLKEAPEFLAGRQLGRRAAIEATAGKKRFFSGVSLSSLKIPGLIKKDPKAALVEIEKHLESDPYNTQSNQYLKEAALALDLPETAAFALQTIIDGNPKDTKTMHELAELYMKHEQPDKAGEVYNRIVRIAPTDLLAVKKGKDAAAKASMKKGGWETAESYRDVMKDKEEAEALEQLGRVVKDESTIDNLLAELYPSAEGNVDVSRRIGELYEQKGDVENAISWFEYAGQLAHGSDPGLVRKITDLQLKRLDDRIRVLKEEMKANGGDSATQQAQTEELENLQRERANLEIHDARSRVERNPTDLVARFELGEILLRSGNAQDAIPELQKARMNPAVRIRAQGLLAQCYVAKNMLDLAAKTLVDAAAEVQAMDSVKKDLLYHLGLVYEKMDKKEKSIECMKQIYEVDYGYKDVAQRVESSY